MADMPIAPAPPILPTPTEVTFLTSVDPLPAEVAGFDRWRTGLSQREVFPGVTGAKGPILGLRRVGCNADEAGDMNDSDITDFRPYGVYVQHGCSGRVNEAEYEREALAVLTQALPFVMADQTLDGSIEPDNPTVAGAAVDITASVPSNPGVEPSERWLSTLGVLTQAFETQTRGARGVVWVPTAALPILLMSGFVNRQGNKFVTVTGHTVMAVPGVGAAIPDGADPLDPGDAFVFVTGPVQAALGEPVVHLPNTGLAERRNSVEVWAERPVVVRFPTENVLALRHVATAA